MNRGFIRVLWGTSGDNYEGGLRNNLRQDVKLLLNNKYEKDRNTVTFVFGSDNFKEFSDLGIKCVLVDSCPNVWIGREKMWRHKMEAFKLGSEVFNEFVFLDIDCLQIAPMPNDFWEVINEKMQIQASLVHLRRKWAYWRTELKNRQVNAAYVYIRGKETALELIKTWEDMEEKDTEEAAIQKYMDDLVGKVPSDAEYFIKFEPDHFSAKRQCAYNPTLWPKKFIRCFEHFHSHKEVGSLLKQIEVGVKPVWAC